MFYMMCVNKKETVGDKIKADACRDRPVNVVLGKKGHKAQYDGRWQKCAQCCAYVKNPIFFPGVAEHEGKAAYAEKP